MIPSLDRPIAQADFAELVGLGASRVSELVSTGVLPAGGTGQAWLVAYCDRLRAESAGRLAATSTDLVEARAALVRAQHEAQELKNAEARGQFASVELLEAVLSITSGAVAKGLDELPELLAREVPGLPEAARAAIQATMARARDEWLQATAHLVVPQAPDDGSDEAPDEP